MEREIETRDKRELISQNLELVIDKKDVLSKYLLNRFNLTNDISFKNIFKFVLNPKGIYQKSLNSTMLKDKTLHRAIRDSANENYNFMWFDYISEIQIIIDFLIGLNFNYKLKITRATLYVGGQEVEATKACSKLISRNNSLFIVDFKLDFKINFDEPNANFVVDYQFGKSHFGFKGTDKVTI